MPHSTGETLDISLLYDSPAALRVFSVCRRKFLENVYVERSF